MRPVIPTDERGDEDGLVLVWVALMIGVLLGVGALVIDAGALYQERRELQNGADAAALAVAVDCAGGDCQDEAATADSYADANAGDGAANVDEVCGSGPGLAACSTTPDGADGVLGWVRVGTSTHSPGGSDDTEVAFALAPVLDAANVGRTVDASSVAAWGVASRIVAAPLAFSVCEFEALGGSLDGDVFPEDPGYIYLHGTGPDHSCNGGPSGTNLPGGFGWLSSTDCELPVVSDTWIATDPGNDSPCDPTVWQNTVLNIPLYDSTQGTGSNGEYHVIGFTGFKVLGYKIGTAQWNLTTCPGTSGTSGRCLYGEFTRVTATGDIGAGTDYGARAIAMIG